MSTRRRDVLIGTAATLLAVATLLAAQRSDAQVRVSVSINGAANNAHNTSIMNLAAGGPDVESVSITWAGNGTWDSFLGTAFTTTPNVGPEDTNRSAALLVTLTPSQGPGGNAQATGDTDGTLSGATAVVRWVGGVTATGPLTLTSGTWGVTLSMPVPARPAHLTWNPPVLNTDGTAYNNPRGYRVYWGTQQGVYPNSVALDNPGLTSYDVTGLTAGTVYYFAATAVSLLGTESIFSNAAQLTAQPAAQNPAPPTGVTSGVQPIPVYVVLHTRNSPNAIQIGTAPADVPCHGEYSIRAAGVTEMLYMIDVELVSTPGVFPEVVYGPCSESF